MLDWALETLQAMNLVAVMDQTLREQANLSFEE